MRPLQEASTERKYPRLRLTNDPLTGSIQIVEVRGRAVQSRWTTIYVRDVSQTGLCFASDVSFPVRCDYLVQMRFTDDGQRVGLQGFIRWRATLPLHNLYLHGCQFTPDSADNGGWTRLLAGLLERIQRYRTPCLEAYRAPDVWHSTPPSLARSPFARPL
ncbi:MAG: PilZ domain-containing protein [Alicyclobacillus sp.]|nr:PilZ domain-containing protein [Alicyclobacillus sp.]